MSQIYNRWSDFFVFPVLAELTGGAGAGSCRVSGVGLLFRWCGIMPGAVPHVSTYLRQALLKPLIVDCRWLLKQSPDCGASAAALGAQGHQTRFGRGERVSPGRGGVGECRRLMWAWLTDETARTPCSQARCWLGYSIYVSEIEHQRTV